MTHRKRFAPHDKVWLCMACGKVSPVDRHGDQYSTKGWDARCVLNSELVNADGVLEYDEHMRAKRYKPEEHNGQKV